MRFHSPFVAALISAASASLYPSLAIRDSEKPNNETFSDVITNQATFDQNFGGNRRQLAFAITKNGTDIRFRMAGPSVYSYVAFGTGDEMKNSMMFIMYRGSDPNKLVLSPRWSANNVEPQYKKGSIDLASIDPADGDYANGIDKNGMMYTTGICRNCTFREGKELIPTADGVPFIFALGPRGRETFSNDLNAPLRRHYHYGRFALDMRNASSEGLPTFKYNSTFGQRIIQGDKIDHDFPESGHAFAMLMAFLIIFPTGVWFQRVLDRTKMHLIFQSIGFGLVLIGFITGIVISRLYNRTQKFVSAHQIIGFIVVALILVQWTLGFLHHRQYVRTQRPLNWAIKPHKIFLGIFAMALAIANGSLGFRLALAQSLNYIYVPFVIFVMLLLIVSTYSKGFFHSRWGAPAGNRPPPPTYARGPQESGLAGQAAYASPGQPGPYQHTGPYAASRSDIALTNLGDPPAYSATPTKPREFA